MIVIFFSKDRAMQLDAAIRSCRMHCKELPFVEKVVIFKTTSKVHVDQYKQLQQKNRDFLFVEEVQIPQQILDLASSFEFISFQCDDNMYIRDFSFSKGSRILLENKSVLGHSLRLGKNITYSYTRNACEFQPEFFSLDQNTFRFRWFGREPRGFGYPLEVSASIYRCEDILPLISNHMEEMTECGFGRIETQMIRARNIFQHRPFLTCDELPSVISVPVNRVGIVPNRQGQKYSYSIKDLAHKFSKNLRINIDQFNNYISNATHVELEFSFEDNRDERME